MARAGYNASQQEAQGEEVTPRRAARLVARREVWLAVLLLCGLLLLALVVGIISVHATTNSIAGSNAGSPRQVPPSIATHTPGRSDINSGPTDHPNDESPTSSNKTDMSLHLLERPDIKRTNHRMTTRSVGNQCWSDENTEHEWEGQMNVSKTVEVSKNICAPWPQYIFVNPDKNQPGVIVNRCPGGCGRCAYISHMCKVTEKTKVKRLVKYMDSDGDACFREHEVEEHTKCECHKDADGEKQCR